MFDELFDKYALAEEQKPDRKQVERDKKAVFALLENESETARTARKPLRIAIVAVAAAACLTVTAGAAVSLNELFGGVFGTRGNALSSEADGSVSAKGTIGTVSTTGTDSLTAPTTADMGTVFDFDKHGKRLDKSYRFDNFTLNLTAIAADDYSAHVLCEVVFDEDFDFAEKEGFTEWDLYVVADTLENSGRTMTDRLISKEGNVLSFYKRLDIAADGATLEGQTVTLRFISLSRCIPTVSEKADEPWIEAEVLPCELLLEIPIDFDTNEYTRESAFNDKLALIDDSGSKDVEVPAVLKSVVITPFNWKLLASADVSQLGKGEAFSADVKFVCKNGDCITTGNSYSISNDITEATYSGAFDTPIDPDSIAYVEINGSSFALGNA